MPEVARTAQNVVYDSAATTYLYRFPVFRTAIDLVGPERVLFASDYPVLRQDRLRRRVDRLGMLEDTARHVMGDNAVRVFGLRQGRQ
jgi:predicted TIM-barrel fold metal-dependent hydrolase